MSGGGLIQGKEAGVKYLFFKIFFLCFLFKLEFANRISKLVFPSVG